MVEVDEIGGVLAAAWPQLRVAGAPEPLRGGFWAQMWRVRVSGQPDEMPTEVVVRFAPHREMGAKEAEVQRAVAALGFRTPRVWLSTPAAPPVDGWWSVMDFAPGAPLLAGLQGAAVAAAGAVAGAHAAGAAGRDHGGTAPPRPAADHRRRAAGGTRAWRGPSRTWSASSVSAPRRPDVPTWPPPSTTWPLAPRRRPTR